MRIIAGEFRSRKLLPPPEEASTRPIPDRVKESLFSILRGHVEGAQVFDAFAGTGAVGLEAISRGASRCVMVEKDRAMAAVLEKNIRTLGVADRCEVVIGDALGAGALARCPGPATIVMLDPPYDLMRSALGARRIKAQLAELVKCLTPDGFAVLRTPWPLFYADEEDPAGAAHRAATPEPRRRGRDDRPGPQNRRGPARRPAAKGRWDEVWTIEKNSREDLDEILEDVGEGDLDAVTAETPAGEPRPERRPIDLAVDGAAGPETHEYGTMALHFYMRAK